MTASTTNAILKRIRAKHRGWVFTPRQFAHLGTRAAVDQALSRLQRTGQIRRLARGVYEFPKVHPKIGVLSPSPEAVAKAMADVDVLVTPTAISVAPTFEGYDPDAMRRQPTFMGIWNLTGLPALSIGCGFSEAGLPIGLQIIGKPFDEPLVFKVADAYQRLTDWHTRSPELALEVQVA